MSTVHRTPQGVSGAIAASTFGPRLGLDKLSDAELYESWREYEGTCRNVTVPPRLRQEARQAASTCWLIGHARGLAFTKSASQVRRWEHRA